MINSVTSAYPPQIVNSVQSKSEQVEPQQREQTGDKVTFSKESLIACFFSDQGIDHTPGKSISLDDIQGGLDRSSAKLTDDVNLLFVENGISLTPPVDLTLDDEGRVRVKGDHPDKEKIEQLFADNPDLSNDFRKVGGMSSFMEAAKEHIEFSKEYAKDPYAAVAKYGHLFDGLKDAPFSMLFGAKQEA